MPPEGMRECKQVCLSAALKGRVLEAFIPLHILPDRPSLEFRVILARTERGASGVRLARSTGCARRGLGGIVGIVLRVDSEPSHARVRVSSWRSLRLFIAFGRV